jgi:hypothetical protein
MSFSYCPPSQKAQGLLKELGAYGPASTILGKTQSHIFYHTGKVQEQVFTVQPQ